MNKQVYRMLGAITLLGGIAYAADEIRINIYTGSFNTNGEITGTETLHTSATRDAGFAITFPSSDPNGSGGNGALPSITDGGGFTRINIYAENNPETHDIGLITVGGSGSTNVHLIIGTQTRATINEPPGVFGRDCKGIDANRPARLQMSISRHLIANIDATDIRRIDVGGSHKFGYILAATRGPHFIKIDGDVEKQTQFSPRILAAGELGIDRIEIGGALAGEIRAETTSTSTSSPIGQVEIGGSLTGIVYTDGNVDEFIRATGDIGNSTTPATISAGGKIAELTAGGDVWADIEVNDGVEVSSATPPDTHTLPRLEVFSVGGDLHGTFNGPSIASLEVGGDLYADLIVGLIRHGSGGNDDWRINGSFKSVASITTLGEVVSTTSGTTWGLRGRVVFNNAYDTGEWEEGALVRVYRVGTSNPELFIELGPEYTNHPYTQLNAATGPGGGAVGVASFELHEEGCAPPHGSSNTAGENHVKRPNPPLEEGMVDMQGAVHVRHYGPVMWDDEAEGLPVVIERRRAGTSNSWDDITDYFEAINGWADLVVALQEITTTECGNNIGFFKGFEYRITPVRSGDEALRCLDVDGDPLVAEHITGGYVYQFEVHDPCPMDLTGNEEVGSEDLATLLTSWGPCPAAPCVCLADFDRDGDVGSDDLATLLTSWGPCSAFESGVPPVVELYGFETVAQYTTWLGSLTEQELADHIVEVLEMLLE